MHIGSGQSPLSLAVLKTLGMSMPVAKATAGAANTIAQAARGTSGKDSEAAPNVAMSPDLGVSKTIPRGSFVDLKA